jgi:competence protein ComEC
MFINEAEMAAAAGQARPAYAAIRTRAGAAGPPVGALARLETALDGERGRWFLWLPVFFGLGIVAYLDAPSEPPVALAAAAVMLGFVLRLFFHATSLRVIASSIVLLVALGFLTAKLHTLFMDGPVLDRTLRFTELSGWVERVELHESRTRLTVRLIAVKGLAADKTPRRARISFRGKSAPPQPGEAIRARATLMPPPEPALPGGFDFARHYWFMGLGATGYATGKIEPLAGAPEAPWLLRMGAWLDRVRFAIAARIDAVLDGEEGALAKALIMGERGELSEASMQALRDSGLAHVVSISGLHMALTAGAIFWAIRAFLALFPSLALRFPIKVWAAAGALVIACLYLAISGAAVTAVRAFIMIAIVFIAVMLNRPAVSQRNLAIAALLILAVMPQSIVDAGFQMSFAATAALIAFYESRARPRLFRGWPAIIAVPLVFMVEAALTTLVAGLAADVFAAYHFHRIAIYSVIGNILAMPAISFLVMPMAPLALIAMPFGLEALPLQIMDWGLSAVLAAASFTAGLPGAVVPVPALADMAFPLMIGGWLWLMIWTGRWRWYGLAAIGAGLALSSLGERADIWIDREGELVAIRDKDGRIATPNVRKASFSLERWMEADGDMRTAKEARGSRSFQCDASSCVAMVKGKLVSHVTHPSALADDCRRAAILIANFAVPEGCGQPEAVIDLLDLKEQGAHAIRISDDGVEISTVAQQRGDRPWVLSFRRRQAIPAKADDPDAAGGASGEDVPDK